MRARAPIEVDPTDREANWAVAVAGGLYFVGALLCATGALLPELRAPFAIGAVGVLALSTSGLLLLVWHRGRGTLTIAYLADLWGVVLIATLCAGSSGTSSPFALIYMFAIGHAAAFQPRGRLYMVALASLVAFLAPIVYETGVSTEFAAVATVGIVMALMTSAAVHFALNRIREQRRRLQVLSAASASLDRSLDPAETLRAISRMAVPELVSVCVVDALDGTGSIGSTVAAAADPALAREIEASQPDPPRGDMYLDGVASLLDEPAMEETGDPPAAPADPRAAPADPGGPRLHDAGTRSSSITQVVDGHEHEAVMKRAGYVYEAAFPMLARGRIHGMITFWRPQQERPFDRGLLTVLEDLSGRAALAYDNARLYAERAQVARTLRRSLMPAALPTIPRLELASYFRPMGAGSEVGGDFYDVISDSDGCWLIVGDVCGKGAEAAALTGFVRHTTAAYARETDRPGRVLTRVNRAMLEQDFEGLFATAILTRMRFRARRRRSDGGARRAPRRADRPLRRRRRRARRLRQAAGGVPGGRHRGGLDGDEAGRRAGALHRRPHRGPRPDPRAVGRADGRAAAQRPPPLAPGRDRRPAGADRHRHRRRRRHRDPRRPGRALLALPESAAR